MSIAISEGWYRIVSAMDTTLCLDVSNGSNADGANIWLYSINDTAAQAFYVKAATGGGHTITSAFGKCLDAQNGHALHDGQNVWAWTPNGTNAQRWTFEDSGRDSVTLNGASFKPVCIASAAQSSFCFDASGGKAYVRDNVQLWTMWKGINQSFLMVPVVPHSTRAIPSAAPASVGAFIAGADASTTKAGTVGVNTSAKFVPSWKSPYYDFQCRYRIYSGGAWSDWSSVIDGSKASDGWGMKVFHAAKSGAWTYYPTTGISVSAGQRIAFEVRPCDVTWSSDPSAGSTTSSGAKHYDPAGGTINAVQNPTVTVAGCTWSPQGIAVTLSVSPRQTGCSGTVKVSKYGETSGFSGMSGGSFSVLLQSKGIPADGASVAVSGSLRTGSGLTASFSATKAITYSDVSGSFSPTITKVAAGVWKTSLASYPQRHVWVLVDGVAREMREDAAGTTWIACPQGKSCSVFCTVLDGSVWKTYQTTVSDIGSEPRLGIVWEGGCEAVRFNAGNPPSLAWTEEANAASDLTTGRGYELTTIGNGRKAAATMKGIWLPEDGDPDKRMTSVLDARFAWLTHPNGMMWRIAITGGNVTLATPTLADVSFDFRRSDG